jgi:dolichyl-diphosphooligosaccharide--protein glycosyltransferase
MAPSSLDVVLKGSSGRNTRGLLRVIILCTIAAAAVSSRLFSVISMFQLPFLIISMLTIF